MSGVFDGLNIDEFWDWAVENPTKNVNDFRIKKALEKLKEAISILEGTENV